MSVATLVDELQKCRVRFENPASFACGCPCLFSLSTLFNATTALLMKWQILAF